MLLLLPSLLCSAYSDLAIDDLPTILCTISSELNQIFSAASSHNAHLLHTFCTHAIFIVVLSINDKHSLSIKYLPTIYAWGKEKLHYIEVLSGSEDEDDVGHLQNMEAN
jgi:hypothetical protein